MALVFHHTNFAQDRLSLTQKNIMVFSIYPNHMMGQKATLQDIIPIFPTFGFPSSLPSLALSLPSPSDSGPPGSCPGGIGPSGSPPENRESKSFVTLSSGLLTPQLTVASGVPYSHGGV